MALDLVHFSYDFDQISCTILDIKHKIQFLRLRENSSSLSVIRSVNEIQILYTVGTYKNAIIKVTDPQNKDTLDTLFSCRIFIIIVANSMLRLVNQLKRRIQFKAR